MLFRSVILLSYAIFGISLFLMSIGHGVIFAYLIAAVFGLYVGISETVSRAIVPRFVGPELRGTAFGIYNLSSGVAFFASNVIFGFLWDSFGLNTGLMYSSIMTGIASIGLVLFMKKFKV